MANELTRPDGVRLQTRIVFPTGAVVSIRGGQYDGKMGLVTEGRTVEATDTLRVHLYAPLDLDVDLPAKSCYRMSYDRGLDGDETWTPAPDFPD